MGTDFTNELYDLHHGNVSEIYSKWPAPDLIVSDGAYGVRGFRGDTTDATGLVDWYQPHVLEWAKVAKPSTSLWFWNTEVGWATVHGQTLAVKEWLRAEWQRSGLPLCKANEACEVKNAATRKYLTADWLWYWPPGEAVKKMADYCTVFGKPTNRPYFSLDGTKPITSEEWDRMRAVWNHRNGITNVWSRPPLADSERLRGTMERSAPRTYKPTKQSAAHLNQKPLDLMLIQIAAATCKGNVVWEPFGGLASASVASVLLGRHACVSEIDDTFVGLAKGRLDEAYDSFKRNGTFVFEEAE